jgi:endoglucanase
VASQLSSTDVDKVLRESWAAYRTHFIKPDGRVFDPEEDESTTSEGQSYAMLRSAYIDDQDTFEKLWSWTKQNLKRSDGKLFAWKWGNKTDGSVGVLDGNTASDADEDIALALIIGGTRWNRPELVAEAKKLLGQIWDIDVIVKKSKAYFGPGNWAKEMDQPILNPSYFAPYAYRLFAKIDREHNWPSVVDTSYDVLNQTASLSRLSLPPDWCNLDLNTGKITFEMDSEKSDYFMDAIRVPWRISLDWQWNHDIRAKIYLSQLYFLVDCWTQIRTISGPISAAGVMRTNKESLAGFCCILPLFAMLVPETAQQVLQEKISSQYYGGLWNPDTDYYGQNWAWFGLASMYNKLDCPKLTAQ